MNIKQRLTRLCAAVVAAVTLVGVAACGGTNNGGGSTASSGDTILFGGDAGSPTFVRNFNPFSTSKRQGINFMYEPLEVINAIDGTLTPFLATGHKIVDAKTVNFTIREGVKWQDGKDLTPADVTFTFDLIKKNAALDTLGVWQHIDSIETSGNDVVFHLKSDDVPGATVIAQQLIVPEHIWKDVKDPVKWTNENPVGSGPYQLDQFTPNQYTLKKNQTYWQKDKVAAEKIVLPASNKQLDLVNKGYDWAYSYMNNVDKTWAGQKDKYNVYWFPPGGTVSLFPNLTKAPFNDVNFRKGLSYALDREKIAKDAEEGYVEGATQTGLLLPNQEKWVSSSIENDGKISQDSDKALEYFAKAGYTKSGDKLVDASGKQLELNITVPNGYTDWLRGVQTMQSQLTKLGISVKLTQPQPAAYTQAQNNGDFDLIISSFGGSGNIFQDYNNLLNSEFALPVGQSTSANFERYSNDATDALLAQLKSATDDAAQKKIVDQLQQVVYDEVPVIGLFYGGLWGLFSNKNFTGWPSADNPYAPPTTWTQAMLLVVTNIKKAEH
ncbi:ABC transporter substrate-binding protein [Bifidobacterium scardovii]|uniref:Dipeptide ABC transporter periplasmic protein n=1 Tax=Bifidobacterium scardovii TaxID=158787 RepID=A0A087D3H8_9BIFI|nr:ABC transporter substrate-binding protein [Bifidobacterium scardovii]KFI90078.1 dipeptide ABC transporter periplasmic protein [Bifidobacterium scardovii]MDK6349190.1 ABC transporter substrate-binding protein [Bifidobacterium scardovii]MDU8980769.1 ABC transporter substrate-binding protein [Bifidobacterium scardovii]BAQ32526.1 putative peptide ABC transporter substrate binding component [Bifidobacterium scardovii JCM 12489 = DSM 13734]